MSISPKHHTLISGLLLICSVASLLLFLQWRYYPAPPGINGQALAAAFSGSSSLQIYERFTGGTLVRSHFWQFSRSFVPAVLVLTVALAVWNFRICRRQS